MSELLQKLKNAHPTKYESLLEKAAANEVPVDKVATEFEKNYNEAWLSTYPENDRLFHAANFTIQRQARSFLAVAEEYTFFVIDKQGGKKIKSGKKRGSIYGYAVKSDGKAQGLVEITTWDEQCDVITSAQPGKAYKVFFGGGPTTTGKLALKMSDKTRFETEVDSGGINAADLLTKVYTPIGVAEAIKSPSKPGDYSDVRLVSASIMFANVRKNKTGGEYGSMTLFDPDMNSKEMKEIGGGLSVMCDPSQIRFGPGTQTLVLGTIQAGNEKFPRPTLNAVAIVSNGPVVPLQTMKTTNAEATGGKNEAQAETEVVDFSSFQ